MQFDEMPIIRKSDPPQSVSASIDRRQIKRDIPQDGGMSENSHACLS